MTMKEQRSPFKFRKNDAIGEPSAELDQDYLLECFEDTGDLEVLRDVTKHKRIVLGRTGSGKSALLIKLRETETNVIWIEPEDLALQFISNSTIIKHLTQAGVNLDRFFKLLWRHVFTAELIRYKYKVESDEDKNKLIEIFRNLFGGNWRKQMALKYLEKWGESFFENTDIRVKELTNTLESNVKSSFGADAGLLKASSGVDDKVTAEERIEVVQRAQEIVTWISQMSP